MPTLRTGPVIGLIVQIVLLVGLVGTVGLGLVAWSAGLAYGAVTCVALIHGLRRAGSARLGPADRVTLARAILVGGVTALVVDSAVGSVVGSVADPSGRRVALMITLTTLALALDAADGYVARRTGTVSALGARFDMEVDAFLILVLSGYLYVAGPVDAWVLVIGGMRYVFVVGIWVLPWMRGTLPPRLWRKVVAAAQGVVLAVAAAGVLPRPLTILAVLGALAMLVESFGHDIAWLWRHRTVAPAAPVTSPAPTARVVPAVLLRSARVVRRGRIRLRVRRPARPALRPASRARVRPTREFVAARDSG